MNLVNLSRELMRERTRENKAPTWLLTELAIRKGKELSTRYDADERLVLASLYLAHTVFNQNWEGDIQKNHPSLSSKFAREYLERWKVEKEDQKIILNAIEAHHGQIPTISKVGEIVKNAECFKFVTIEGSLIWLHDLGTRNVPFKEACHMVLKKMEQKKNLLTLEDCMKEAEENCMKIREILNETHHSSDSDQ